MGGCVRSGCPGSALAPWWGLCAPCTAPLLEPLDAVPSVADDQLDSAGWDAVGWAERIAPARWGHADGDDAWLTEVRCLAVAAVVTGRSDGCPHSGGTGATPVVAVARAPGSLRCPTCARAVIAAVTTDGHACDRCRSVAVGHADRAALVAGRALVVVAQLCDRCFEQSLALGSLLPEG